MSNVTLSIGGRSYTVACAEGEESHVLRLGSLIDRKLGTMGDMSGQAETRMLLFASLLLADELHEAGGSAPPAAASDASGSLALAEKLLGLADRLEKLATQLES